MAVEIRTNPIPFAMQKDNGRSKVSSLQNVKNFVVEPTPQAESPFALIFSPGCRPYASLPAEAGAVVGGIIANDSVYFCTTRSLWRIGANSYSLVANHTIVGRASMAFNGEHIMYVDGYKSYAYNVNTGAHTEIDIPPANTVDYQDGYFLVNKAATNEWAVSNLDSIVFDPLQFATAEGAPDNTLAVLSDHREVWIFCSTTIEVWYNSGNDFPFDRIQGAFIEHGLAATHAHTKANNTVYWLGDDRIVYSAQGYTPVPIGSNAIHTELAEVDVSDAWMSTYTQEGHIFIWLTVPSISKTYVFDTMTGLWSERTNLSEGRHIANVLLENNGQTLVGDFRSPEIYVFDLAWPYDGESELIERDVTLPPLFNSGNRLRQGVFELKMQNISGDLQTVQKLLGVWTADQMCVTADSIVDTADGYWPDKASCCPPPPSPIERPQIGLRMTDNHGQSWTPFSYVPAAKPGGVDARWRWWRLGTFYERTFNIRAVVPYTGVWIGAYIG